MLLVETHPALRKSIRQILEDTGITVLSASSVKQAVRLEAGFPGTIDLLLADLRIAGTSGPQLARKLQERRPQMRSIYVSGYPAGALLVLNGGWRYIEKLSVPAVLAGVVQHVLRGQDALLGETRQLRADWFESLQVRRRSRRGASARFPGRTSGRPRNRRHSA